MAGMNVSRSVGRSVGRRGFSLIEILAVIGIISLLITILVPVVGTVRESAQRTSDSGQIRGVVQGFGAWAAGHDGLYPLPSRLDASDQTVTFGAGAPTFQKDTTAAIFSVLVWNKFLEPTGLISPAETNGSIVAATGYEFGDPDGAVNPRYALWDPDFRGTPGDAGVPGSPVLQGFANLSYAHAMPFGPRLANWGTSGGGGVALVSNRGSLWENTTSDQNGVFFRRAGEGNTRGDIMSDALYFESNTLASFNPRQEWSGHVSYNDASVGFQRDPGSRQTIGADGEGELLADNVFLNEDLDGDGRMTRVQIGRGANNYLRAYTNVRDPMMTGNREDAEAEVFDIQTARDQGYVNGD